MTPMTGIAIASDAKSGRLTRLVERAPRDHGRHSHPTLRDPFAAPGPMGPRRKKA